MKQPKPPILVLIKCSKIDHKATGALVRKYRESFGVTQAMVAARMGMAYETIVSDLERGARVWTPAKLDRVVAAIEGKMLAK